MTTPANLKIITGWMSDLVNMTTATASTDKNKIATMASMIADELPVEAFTRESLRAVATGCDFFPHYSKLHQLLSAWWEDNKPKPVFALPAPDDPTLDGTARAYVKSWLSNRAANFDHIRHVGDLDARMALALDVVRLHCDAAFNYICRTDAEAQKVALRKGWLRDASDKHKTDEERAAVHTATQAALKAIRTANIPVAQHMHTTAAPEPERRKNHELSPEELAAARKVAGIHQTSTQRSTPATDSNDTSRDRTIGNKADDSVTKEVPRWDWEKTLREATADEDLAR